MIRLLQMAFEAYPKYTGPGSSRPSAPSAGDITPKKDTSPIVRIITDPKTGKKTGITAKGSRVEIVRGRAGGVVRATPEAIRAEEIRVKEIKETPSQKALILAAAQREVKATPKFEALRARRLAEIKKEIKAPTAIEAMLARGRITITGEARPFKPVKEVRKEVKPISEVQYRLKPKGFIERKKEKIYKTFAERVKETQETQAYLEQQKRLGKPIGWWTKERGALVGISLGYVGLSAARGFVTPFLKPVETVKGVYQLVRHPIISIKAIGAEFKERPLGTSAEMFGTMGAFKVVGLPIAKVKAKYLTKTKVDIKTTVYKPTIRELKKTAPIGKKLIRKEGIKFEYPRKQVLVKAIGKKAPVVAISKGIVKKGFKKYDVRIVQVGRAVYGTMRRGKRDIIFKKTPTGKMQVKYITRAGRVTKIKKLPFKIEEITLKREKMIYTKLPKKTQFDIGRMEGGAEAFSTRITQRLGRYRAVGKQVEFKGMRDIKKSFLGEAKTKLQQVDTAHFQKEIVTIGKRKIITFREPDIKYALQPKYKPSYKIYKYDVQPKGIVPIIEYLKRPKLITRRETKFISETRYAFEKSRIKPIKALGKAVGKMGKKGEVLLRKRKVIVRAERPELKLLEPTTRPPIHGELVIPMLEQRLIITPFIITKPKARVEIKPITRARAEVRTRAKAEVRIKPEIKPKLEIRPIVRVRAKPEVRARVEVRPKVELKIRTIAKTMAQVPVSITPFHTRPTPPTPPPPPPPPFILPPTPLLRRRPPKKKKPKKIKRMFKYTATIQAGQFKIYGRRPQIESGVGIRPLLPSWR